MDDVNACLHLGDHGYDLSKFDGAGQSCHKETILQFHIVIASNFLTRDSKIMFFQLTKFFFLLSKPRNTRDKEQRPTSRHDMTGQI